MAEPSNLTTWIDDEKDYCGGFWVLIDDIYFAAIISIVLAIVLRTYP